MSVTYKVVKSSYERGDPGYEDAIRQTALTNGANGVFLQFSGTGISTVDVRSMNPVIVFEGKFSKAAFIAELKKYERAAAARHSSRVAVAAGFMYPRIVEKFLALRDLYMGGKPLEIVVNAPDYSPKPKEKKPKAKILSEESNGSLDGLLELANQEQTPPNGHVIVQGNGSLIGQNGTKDGRGQFDQLFRE
ncbi:hypothetical protein HYV80_04355 [Candidatus Woesearchaeota archaeon]|nr:hypothetical protein [Candidatus Woesearchaeota archaeon]